jgi:hypothetical protein
MSADAYINRVMSQNAVYSRSVLWLPMTGPIASWCDSYGTSHLLAFSAILCTLRMSLEHWAFGMASSRREAAPICLQRERGCRSQNLEVAVLPIPVFVCKALTNSAAIRSVSYSSLSLVGSRSGPSSNTAPVRDAGRAKSKVSS